MDQIDRNENKCNLRIERIDIQKRRRFNKLRFESIKTKRLNKNQKIELNTSDVCDVCCGLEDDCWNDFEYNYNRTISDSDSSPRSYASSEDWY